MDTRYGMAQFFSVSVHLDCTYRSMRQRYIYTLLLSPLLMLLLHIFFFQIHSLTFSFLPVFFFFHPSMHSISVSVSNKWSWNTLTQSCDTLSVDFFFLYIYFHLSVALFYVSRVDLLRHLPRSHSMLEFNWNDDSIHFQFIITTDAGYWKLHCNQYFFSISFFFFSILSLDMNVQFNFITHYLQPDSFFFSVLFSLHAIPFVLSLMSFCFMNFTFVGWFNKMEMCSSTIDYYRIRSHKLELDKWFEVGSAYTTLIWIISSKFICFVLTEKYCIRL